MGQIQRLNRGRVKPYNSKPRIDWSDPITAGLATYCYDAGGVIVDLVNGGKITMGANGTAPFGSKQTQFGRGLQFPLDGWGSMPPLPTSSGVLNGLAGAVPYSASCATFQVGACGPTSPDGAMVSVQDSGNTENTLFGFNSFGTNQRPGNGTRAVVINNQKAPEYAAAIVFNTFQTWGYTATDSTHGIMYAGGVFDAGDGQQTGNPQTTSGVSFTAPQVMYNTASINAGQTFGNAINGFVYYFAMWHRGLSAAEHLRLHLDPWSFLIYPEEEMLAPAVGVAMGGGSAGTAAGIGAATGVGSSAAVSTASAAGHGTATGIGASAAVAAGSATGTSTATGIGAAIAASLGSASGAGIATGIAASIAASIGSAGGIGAASGIGKSTATAVGTASGVGAAAAVALGAGSVGAASGAGTAIAVGASIATSIGLVAGVGVAMGVAASAAASVGSSSGTGAATATGASTAKSIGNSSGAGTAAAISASIAAAIGSAFGTGAAGATAASGAPTGLASGIGTATSVGASIVAAVGTSMGFGSAAGAIVNATPETWTPIVIQPETWTTTARQNETWMSAIIQPETWTKE